MKKILFLIALTLSVQTIIAQDVVIGTQTWTTKNLDVATYSDGTVIPQVTDDTEWANLTTGAWCYYNNDPANGTIYGKLYNWYALNGIYNEASKTNTSLRKKLAPTGYYIPSNADWTILTTYLGGANIAGGKMKETGTTHWSSPNTSATNSSGFTGLPSGYRNINVSFGNIGDDCHLWSSSEVNNSPLTRFLSRNVGNFFTNNSDYKSGFSVRCLKNTTSNPTASAQTLCSSATVESLVATGTNLKWYTTPTEGTALALDVALASGTYYVSQTLNNLESERTAVEVTLTPLAKPGISGTLKVCAGTTPSESELFAVLKNADVGGTWSQNGLVYTYTVVPTLPCTTEVSETLPFVSIGSQNWTNRNLDLTTYSDGTVIPEVAQSEWNNLTTGAWCYYNNDPVNGAIYGKLYNWYAVAGIYNEASKTDASIRKKLAPTGWHVPSNSEWATLADYLGGYDVAGYKMKEIGTSHWESPNTSATNSSGFTGLAGGYNFFYGGSSRIKVVGGWWSSTETNNSEAFIHALNSNYDSLGITQDNKNYGFSVRFIKNVVTTATVTVIEQATANAGTDGTLTLCEGKTPTESELFTQLGGSPSAGGSWSQSGLVYTYTIAATSPCTTSASASVTVTYKSVPSTPITSSVTYCQNQTAIPLTASQTTGTLKWYNSEITATPFLSTPTPKTNTVGTIKYYVSQTSANGCESNRAQLAVIVYPIYNVSICYVSSDETETIKNRIYINNNGNYNVDTFQVFKEGIASGVYELIGEMGPNQNSFLDIDSDNTASSCKYRVKTKDISGLVSNGSSIHKTILLQSNLSTNNTVNLSWTAYDGVTYGTYTIYRKVNDGAFELLKSISSSNMSYTDVTANTSENKYSYYVSIDVNPCSTTSSTKLSNKKTVLANQIRSNYKIVSKQGGLGIEDNTIDLKIKVYPNPTSQLLYVSHPDQKYFSIHITDLNGKQMYSGTITTATPLDIAKYPQGMYFVTVTSKDTNQKNTYKIIKK
jgi:uncharacterized protein (TIGR02145 family)